MEEMNRLERESQNKVEKLLDDKELVSTVV